MVAEFLRCPVGGRRMRPYAIVVVAPRGEHRAGLGASDEKAVSFRHSSRSGPLKLSTNAFCCGLSGWM